MGHARCSSTCLTGPHTFVVIWIHFRTIGQTSADFSNHRVLTALWKVHERGAFSIPRKMLGLRPTCQSCHHETWLHLDFVDWNNRWSKHDVYEQNISFKERPADLLIRDSKKTY